MNKIIICIFILITSCSSLEQRSKLAFTIANKAGFSSILYQDSGYSIQSFAKRSSANSPIISIYIEGDGRSWIDRNTISSNPTPTTPLALELAALDQSPKVIYLARPCQYVSDPKCSAKVWTSHQFSQAVVMSYMQVLDQIKKISKKPKKVSDSPVKQEHIVEPSKVDKLAKKPKTAKTPKRNPYSDIS